ncbi:MAG: hypothetical protein ABIK83_07460 [Candidatus Zixiibacteriota bacterium]
MSEKKPTTTGTKISVFVILLFVLWIIANRDNFSQHQQATNKPAVAEPVAAKPAADESRWVQPKIYPDVKLYYSHDGTQMQYIGTICDAIGRTINGERCFGIVMASGSREYKLRAILWNGHWFMDRVQGQKAIDKFTEQ